ncbi:MAG: hypothetical protein LBV02_04375, partial [Bacteroidales bacterium]|nr:hypothetical protein [Bacteroidales bacterium]
MKKSVSFCFLSILLVIFGFLPKIAQGQQACDCLWLENLDPNVDSLERTTLAPTLNDVVGRTDIYQIHFDPCTEYAPDTKVSLEWEIYHDGNLLDGGTDLRSLSRYAVVSFEKDYERIAGYLHHSLRQGVCEIINEEIVTYPGAITVYPGLVMGEGYSLDYFYLHFFQATENRMKITWKQAGNYTFVLKLVERVGRGAGNGTPYESFYYDAAQELPIGGHWTNRGAILASDTFKVVNRIPKYDEICFDTRPYLIGNPQLSFNFSDTLILADVAYYNPICTTKMDSIIELELVIFPELGTPQVENREFCEYDESDTLSAGITQSARISQLDNVGDIVLEWKTGENGAWSRVAPIQGTSVPDTFYYYVRYALDGELITCTGDSVEMMVIVHPAPLHVFPSGMDTVEYCINGEASALQVPEVAGTHVEWLVNNAWVTTAPTPRTNVAGMTNYLVRRVDSETGCISASTDTVKVYVYALPNVEITANNNPICHGYELELTASGADTYVWNVQDNSGSGRTDTVLKVTALNTFTYQVVGTENHFEISCANTDSLEVTVRPEITVAMDSAACSGQVFTVNPIVADNVTFVWNNGLPKTFDTTFMNTGNAPIYVKWGYTLTNNTTNCTKVDTMVIQVNPVPVAHIVPAIDTVCAEVSFFMTAVDSFAYANSVQHTYLWANGSTDNPGEMIFNVAGDTTVTVEITNEYQCSDYATANVHVYPAPLSGILGLDTVCQYDEITLTAVGDYEFYWMNTGETTREITFTMTEAGDTTFTLLAKDSLTDCPKYFTHIIFVNPAPNYTPESDKSIYCEGETVTLEATEHAADETYTYVWTVSPGVTISGNPVSFVVDLTETFFVTATNTVTGCERQDSVTVTVNPLPRITYEFMPNTLPDAPLCHGDLFRVTANAGSNMYYHWMHNPSQGATLSTTVRNSDTIPVVNHYPIEVTDLSTSCVKYDTVKITIVPTPRPVIVASANVICADDFATLSLTKEYASYSWSTGETTPSIVVNTAGPFKVTVSNLVGCSAASSDFNLVVNPLPQVTLVSKTPHDTVCEQEATLYMEVNAGNINAAYVWSYNGLTTPAITVPAERVFNNTNSPINMDFFVTVTNTYTGCKTIDTITYVVNPNPQPIIVFDIPNNDNRICLGDSVTLRAEDYRDYDNHEVLTHYQWTHNSSHDTALVEWPTVTTIYTLSATNTYMCRKTTSDTVKVMPRGTIEILTEDGQPVSDTLCPNTNIRLVANPDNLSQYNWGSGFTSDPFIDVTASGKYVVVADDPNGCTIMSDTFRLYLHNEVDFSLTGATTVCTPQSYTLYASSSSGAEYEFTWPDGTTSISNTTASWTTNLADYGNHVFPVSARDILTNCVGIDTMRVNVVNLPGTDLNITHSKDTVCAGEEVTFFASVKTGVSYAWNAPAVGTNDTATAKFVVPGNNVVTLTISDNATGCENTAADTIYVHPVLGLAIENLSQQATICDGTTIQLIATSALADATFAWYAGNSATPFAATDTVTITPDNTTLYTVIATSSNGCTEIDTITIKVIPSPQYTTTNQEILACIGANVVMSVITADAGMTYEWSDLSTDSTITKTITEDTVFTVNIIALNGCVMTETFTIEAQFLGTGLAFTDSVCSGSNVAFTVVNPNGISSSTVYTWNGKTGTNPYQTSFTSPGNQPISLVMTDAVTGCTFTIDTTIFVYDIPGAEMAIALKTICHGDQVTLEGPTNGGLPYESYRWFNDSTTRNITIVPDAPNAVDTFYYTVTVFDGHCYNTVNAPVLVNSTPDLDLTIVEGNTACHGATVRVVATPADPTQNYTYLWGNTIGTDTLFATPANTGSTITTETYTLTLTNLATGCQTVESIDLDVRPAPVVEIYTEYPYFCKGDYGVLDADRTEQFVAWNWSTGENTRSIYVDTAGTYVVTVTDIHGCTAVDTYVGPEVIDVELNVSASNTVICANSAVTISADPAGNTVPVSITWYLNADSVGVGTNFDTGNLVNTTGDTLVYEFTAVGVHALPGVTCMPTETITIAVLPVPDPVVVGAVNDTIFACLADESITLSGYDAVDYASTTLAAYAWSVNGSMAADNAETVAPFVFNYTVPGQYDGTLTLTNGFDCATTYYFVVNVVDAVIPQIVSENGNYVSDTVCTGENLTLSVATQGSGWIWNNAISSRTLNLTNLQADTTVKVTTASGCYGVGSYFVKVSPLPTVVTMRDTTVCGDATIDLAVQSPENGVTYIWINAATETHVDTAVIATVPAGSYKIMAVNTITGC